MTTRSNDSVKKGHRHWADFSISIDIAGKETTRVVDNAVDDPFEDLLKDMQEHSPSPGLPSRRLALALAMLTSLSTAFAEEVQVGRYATVRAVPTLAQVNLLSAPVSAQFPASVTTVGQAVAYLLRPSGYRLAPDVTADTYRAGLLALPLPEPHRALGPMLLQTALETLGGPAFRLVEDPVHRLVTFERCGPTDSGTSAMSDSETR